MGNLEAPNLAPLRFAYTLADRHKWLDAVAEKGAAPGEQFIVAYRLAGMVNSSSGEAWPSLDTLAEKAGVSRRTAQRAVQSLRGAGALDCRRRGMGMTWVFRLVNPTFWGGF